MTEGRSIRIASLAFVALLAAISAAAQSLSTYDVPTAPPTDLYAMCVGPDGAIWFGEARTWKVGRINGDGTITEFSTVGPAYQMTAGPDGNIWIADGGVGRLSMTGEFTDFPVPEASPGNGADVIDITAGPDGAVWFADSDGKRIGRITPAGDFTFYSVPMGITPIEPYAITLGPDGNLWFADRDHDVIGRVTPAGVFTTFLIPGSQPWDVAPGPDGNVWFVGAVVGRVSPSGEIQTFVAGGNKITQGHNGDLYFSDFISLSRITTEGEITHYNLPIGSIYDLVAAPDGEIWFTDSVDNKIERLVPSGQRLPVQRPHPERPSPRVVPERPE